MLHSRMGGPQELRVETLALQLQLVASHRRDRGLDAAAGHGTRTEETMYWQFKAGLGMQGSTCSGFSLTI